MLRIGVALSSAGRAGFKGVTEATVPEPGIAPIPPLTAREREVLQQAALGMSNRQIGDQLNIAEQTVKNHLSSAMRKLSIHDRTQAVVMALGHGWIALPVIADADTPAPGDVPFATRAAAEPA